MNNNFTTKDYVLIYEDYVYDYHDNHADEEALNYENSCPCGKGKIIEQHQTGHGHRKHKIEIVCDDCKEKYKLVKTTNGKGWSVELK